MVPMLFFAKAVGPKSILNCVQTVMTATDFINNETEDGGVAVFIHLGTSLTGASRALGASILAFSAQSGAPGRWWAPKGALWG